MKIIPSLVSMIMFRSFGPGPTAIEVEHLTHALVPNGAGKTAVLHTLSRLVSPLEVQRKILLRIACLRSRATTFSRQPPLG
jgi:predicted ATP-binding protein involved in virulence